MREFRSLGAFAEHLLTLPAMEALALHHGLKLVAERVEKTAKAEIGFYQAGVGPFPAWEPLADSTEAEKARLGFEPDAPLLREGDLRDSITHEVGALEAVIGSQSDIALYQELGTRTIPPRPFLGPAVIHNEKKIVEIVGAAAFSGIIGSARIHPSLGYDKDVGD